MKAYFLGGGNVYFHGCGAGYRTISNSQNSSNSMLKIGVFWFVDYSSIKLTTKVRYMRDSGLESVHFRGSKAL